MIVLPLEDISATVTRRDGRVYVVSHSERVAVAALCAAIEHYWYHPGTSRNRFYDLYGTEWRRLCWLIMAFPLGRLDEVRRLAKQLGLRVVDGSPAIIGQENGQVVMQVTARPSRLMTLIEPGVPVEFFPGTMLPSGTENLSIFTIENDKNSPVYKARRHDTEAMLQASEEINEILNKGVNLTPAQIADYIYGSGAFPNEK